MRETQTSEEQWEALVLSQTKPRGDFVVMHLTDETPFLVLDPERFASNIGGRRIQKQAEAAEELYLNMKEIRGNLDISIRLREQTRMVARDEKLPTTAKLLFVQTSLTKAVEIDNMLADTFLKQQEALLVRLGDKDTGDLFADAPPRRHPFFRGHMKKESWKALSGYAARQGLRVLRLHDGREYIAPSEKDVARAAKMLKQLRERKDFFVSLHITGIASFVTNALANKRADRLLRMRPETCLQTAELADFVGTVEKTLVDRFSESLACICLEPAARMPDELRLATLLCHANRILIWAEAVNADYFHWQEERVRRSLEAQRRESLETERLSAAVSFKIDPLKTFEPSSRVPEPDLEAEAKRDAAIAAEIIAEEKKAAAVAEGLKAKEEGAKKTASVTVAKEEEKKH